MQIFVTKKAEKQLDNIVTSIRLNWGNNVVIEFINKLDNIFILLKSFPTMGHIEFKDIRGFQLTSQTKLLYRIKNDMIIILSFFDTRQNPSNLNKN